MFYYNMRLKIGIDAMSASLPNEESLEGGSKAKLNAPAVSEAE